MLKKTLKYTNAFTDDEVTEDHYFHLSKADVIELEVTLPGGFKQYMDAVVRSGDNERILEAFKILVRKSYGRRNETGGFVKDPNKTAEFMSGDAYSEFLIALLTNEDAASEFLNGIMPKGLDKMAEEIISRKNGATQSETQVLTPEEAGEMDADELQSGLVTGRYKLS